MQSVLYVKRKKDHCIVIVLSPHQLPNTHFYFLFFVDRLCGDFQPTHVRRETNQIRHEIIKTKTFSNAFISSVEPVFLDGNLTRQALQ